MTKASTSTRYIAIANQKGGVGKTTTAINLASGLALLHKKVLVVDCDAQANATSGLGLSLEESVPSLYDCLFNNISLTDVIRPTNQSGLFLIPAQTNLVGIDVTLAEKADRESLLKNFLSEIHTLGFDFVFMDCPPSLGILTVNALNAANSVIIPLQCEYYALEGLSQLVQTIRLVKHKLNPKLHIEGLVLTMYDHRTKLGYQVAREVRVHFRDLVYRTTIPRNIKLSESPSHGKPIFLYDPTSKGAESYLALSKEFLSRNRRKK